MARLAELQSYASAEFSMEIRVLRPGIKDVLMYYRSVGVLQEAVIMRQEALDLVRFGSLPSEDDGERQINVAETLLARVPKPMTDEEAQALIAVFGPDDCFDLAWTLLHLIETAPRARTAVYRRGDNNPWIQLLNDRVAAVARGDDGRTHPPS